MAKFRKKRERASQSSMFYAIRTRSRGSRRFRQIATHPATFIAGCALVLAVAVWLLLSLIIPPPPPKQEPAQNTFGKVAGEIDTKTDETFKPDVKEIMLRVRKIGDPVIYGDEAIFAGGTDSAGNPKLRTVYHYDLKTKADKQLSQIVLQNDDIMNLT
ncbi:MAG: hypothetical protein ACOYU3_04165, partial [Bacillota bacterium]